MRTVHRALRVARGAPRGREPEIRECHPVHAGGGLFSSDFPEALSSSANMLAGGMPRRRIFLMWFALMLTTAVGAGLSFLLARAAGAPLPPLW